MAKANGGTALREPWQSGITFSYLSISFVVVSSVGGVVWSTSPSNDVRGSTVYDGGKYE
jgi:hypothetical protein